MMKQRQLFTTLSFISIMALVMASVLAQATQVTFTTDTGDRYDFDNSGRCYFWPSGVGPPSVHSASIVSNTYTCYFSTSPFDVRFYDDSEIPFIEDWEYDILTNWWTVVAHGEAHKY